MQYPTHITTRWIHLLVFSHAQRADRIKFKNRSRWLRGGEGAAEGWWWSFGEDGGGRGCLCAHMREMRKKQNFLISHSTRFQATVVLMPDLTVCQTKDFTLWLDTLSNYCSASVAGGRGGMECGASASIFRQPLWSWMPTTALICMNQDDTRLWSLDRAALP